MIHNELMFDDIKIPKHKTVDNLATINTTNNATTVADEQDFDFVENNIPDLKLDDPEKPAGILAALVSSIYKRTTTI